MKRRFLLGWSSALCLSALALQAQETNQIDQLRKQLQQMQENFEKVQQQQREQIEALKRQIEGLQPQRPAPAAITQPAPRPAPDAPPVEMPGRPWSPAQPIRLGGGQSYLNLSFDGLFAAGGTTAGDVPSLQLGGHDPSQRGFTVQNIEVVLEGMVDPYFRGQANLIFLLDPEGETVVELEEAFLESLSLPANLQLKAGQFFTEFGRHNPVHPHAWSFVDVPLVSGRFLGPDGLRNPGARVSWLMPSPFYSELFLTVQNSQGATAASFRSAGHGHGDDEESELPLAFRHADNDRGLRNAGDLLFTPRYAVSFDLTENQVLLLGASAAFGPNSRGGAGGGDTGTQIYGADLTWKWKSPRAYGGFPFVMVQTEAMLRKYKAGAFDWDEDGDGAPSEGELVDDATGLPAVLRTETLTDYGFYAQLLYGFRRGWVAGLRGDFVAGDRGAYEKMNGSRDGEPVGRDLRRARRWRISPNLTWYPSEYSKFRLQYNYDRRQELGTDHSVWLQFEFLLGAHAAHKF